MTAARVVIHLDEYRRTAPMPAPTDVGAVAGGSGCRPGLTYRLAHSPAARDARRFRDEHDQVLAAGLLIALVLVLIWSLR